MIILVQLIGGIGVFLLGMVIMTEGLLTPFEDTRCCLDSQVPVGG